MSKLCTGWDAPSHRVLRVQTVEVAGVATLNLCPLCIFALGWDPLLQGAVEFVDDDVAGFAWSYLDPLPKEQHNAV